MASYYQRPETKHYFVSFYPKPGSKIVRTSLGTDDPALAEKATQKIDLLCALERLAKVPLPDKVLGQFSISRLPVPSGPASAEGPAPTQTPPSASEQSKNTIKLAIEAYLTRAMVDNVKHAQDDKVSRLRQFFGSELVDSLDPRPVETKMRIRKRKLVKPWFKGTELDEITSIHMLKFLMEKKYSQSMKRHYRETFHQLYQIALKSGIYKPVNPYNANPADDLPGFTKREEPVTVLSRDQVDQQYLAVARDPVILFGVRLMIEAGLRLHEALVLRRCDLARTEKIRLILPEIENPAQTGLKTGERTITARSVIQPYIKAFLGDSAPHDATWCFQGSTGDRMSTDAFGEKLRKLNRAAGLPWTSQDYRHTYATERIAEGWNLKTIAQEMGTSVTMLMTYYAGYIAPPVQASNSLL